MIYTKQKLFRSCFHKYGLVNIFSVDLEPVLVQLNK